MNNAEITENLKGRALTDTEDMRDCGWNGMTDALLATFIGLCTTDPVQAEEWRMEMDSHDPGQSGLDTESLLYEYDFEPEEGEVGQILPVLVKQIYLVEAIRCQELRASGEIEPELDDEINAALIALPVSS
jgi:hypothetical protein